MRYKLFTCTVFRKFFAANAALFTIIIIAGCKKIVQPKPLDASFTMSEVIEYGPYAAKFEPYDTDSAVACIVRFTANQTEESNISYEWTVGTDPTIFKNKSFVVSFCNSPARAITVKLIVKKENQINGSIIEQTSTSRKLSLQKNTTIYGSYLGKYEGDNNNYILKIEPNIYLSVQNEMGLQDYTGILISSNNRNNDTVYLPNNWRSSIALLSRSLYLYFFEPIPTIYQVNKTITPRKINSILNKNNRDLDILIEGTIPQTYTTKIVHFKGVRI